MPHASMPCLDLCLLMLFLVIAMCAMFAAYIVAEFHLLITYSDVAFVARCHRFFRPNVHDGQLLSFAHSAVAG